MNTPPKLPLKICGIPDSKFMVGIVDATGFIVAETPHKERAEWLVALANASQWQPIETAPEDGTRIIASAAGYEWPVIAHYEYNELAERFSVWRDSEYRVVDIKYWLPIPDL